MRTQVSLFLLSRKMKKRRMITLDQETNDILLSVFENDHAVSKFITKLTVESSKQLTSHKGPVEVKINLYKILRSM